MPEGDRRTFDLRPVPGRFAIVRLPAGAAAPDWARGGAFLSITRTAAETSIVCDEAAVPEGVTAQRGFRALVVQGPLDFSEVGVLASLAGPLAAARLSIFAVSTYDTDYLLLRDGDWAGALAALRAAGHHVADGS